MSSSSMKDTVYMHNNKNFRRIFGSVPLYKSNFHQNISVVKLDFNFVKNTILKTLKDGLRSLKSNLKENENIFMSFCEQPLKNLNN